VRHQSTTPVGERKGDDGLLATVGARGTVLDAPRRSWFLPLVTLEVEGVRAVINVERID
jgi:hypothetical protein